MIFDNNTDTGSIMLSRQLRRDDEPNTEAMERALADIEKIRACAEHCLGICRETEAQLSFLPSYSHSVKEQEEMDQAVRDHVIDRFYPWVRAIQIETGNSDLWA